MNGAGRGGALSIRNAGKIYDPEGVHVVALEDVSFDTQPGEFCVVVGPSGCGKTTLLNSIAGFDRLTSGEIFLDGGVLARPGKPPLPNWSPAPGWKLVFQFSTSLRTKYSK